jgi:hypothetical protein
MCAVSEPSTLTQMAKVELHVLGWISLSEKP